MPSAASPAIRTEVSGRSEIDRPETASGGQPAAGSVGAVDAEKLLDWPYEERRINVVTDKVPRRLPALVLGKASHDVLAGVMGFSVARCELAGALSCRSP
jgi:hypothetical protein